MSAESPRSENSEVKSELEQLSRTYNELYSPEIIKQKTDFESALRRYLNDTVLDGVDILQMYDDFQEDLEKIIAESGAKVGSIEASVLIRDDIKRVLRKSFKTESVSDEETIVIGKSVQVEVKSESNTLNDFDFAHVEIFLDRTHVYTVDIDLEEGRVLTKKFAIDGKVALQMIFIEILRRNGLLDAAEMQMRKQ